MLARARDVLDAMDRLEELSADGRAEPRGRVRISTPITFGITRVTDVLVRLSEQHPGLSVELVLDDRRIDLIGDGFDLAVRIGELPDSSMIARTLGTYGFACCASSPHLERHGTPRTPDELAGVRCVLNLNMVPRDHWPFRDASGERVDVRVGGRLEIDNGEAMRAAARTGAGVIYAPRLIVERDLSDGSLVEILPDWSAMSSPIHVVYPSRSFVPGGVAAVVNALLADLGGRAGG